MASRIVFFGNERIATAVTTSTPTLRALVAAGYDVAAVVVSSKASSSRSKRELEIEATASKLGLTLLTPERPTDLIDDLQGLGPQIGVLVAYGRIIPQAIIDIFPHGIINIHPSLLPKHRGPIPIESIILEGATTTGVSIMGLSATMDAGPVWSQSKLDLSGTESKQDLADQLLARGSQLLTEVLPAILNGTATPTSQNETAATTDGRLSKADGKIDWAKPAVQLEREIRAYLGWPGSYTQIGGRDVIITAAHVEPANSVAPGTVVSDAASLRVATSQDWLVVDRLKPAGKREMTAAEFVAGVPKLR